MSSSMSMDMSMPMSSSMSMSMPMTSSMSMDMGSTATAAAAAATSSMAMDMDMAGMGGDCKISMLWNWYTVDACFLSSTWHITSKGMFAGSCIGVIMLVVSLEFLRRLSREYDRYIVRQFQRSIQVPVVSRTGAGSASTSSNGDGKGERITAVPVYNVPNHFRPNLMQQTIRAVLHMFQFAVAYFIMLLAMYFNGYIIICIIIGAFLGAFIFSWEGVAIGTIDSKEEATMCCG